MSPDELDDLLRAQLSGRAVVTAIDWLGGSVGLGDELAGLGVEVRGHLAGVGELSTLDDDDVAARTRLVPVGASDMMAGIHGWDRLFADDDPRVVAALDELDPDGRAAVLLPFWATATEVAGRPVLGARHPSWVALDDKLAIDAVWDAAGVDRAPSRVVSSRKAAELFRAHEELSSPLGTIWAADNTGGWHGGAEGLRWVPAEGAPTPDGQGLHFASTAEHAQRAWAWAGARAEHVRVMPFLDGIPCSVHALVTGDVHVATFRPCEMVVLRDLARHRLRYGGAATSWEPSAQDTAAMQDVARRVGEHLRATLGYRGFLTIDGVLTADGFLPTELNPRFGAALSVQSGRDPSTGATQLPLLLLHHAVVQAAADAGGAPRLVRDRDEPSSADEDRWRAPGEPSWDTPGIEALVRRTAAEHPSAGGHLLFDGVEVDEERTASVELDDHQVDVVLGPTTSGARLRVDVVDAPVGPPAAPVLARAWSAAGEAMGIEVPDLTPAPSLR